jgi:hypothetical protein
VKVSVPLRDVTPATTAAEQGPDAFARDTAMEVPDEMQLWELPEHPRQARRQPTKTAARGDLIGRRLVAQAGRSKDSPAAQGQGRNTTWFRFFGSTYTSIVQPSAKR